MSNEDQQLANRFAALSPEARRGFLSKLQEAGFSFAELPIIPATREREQGCIPMSYAQRSLWLTWKLDPASPAYNMAGVLRFKGRLDEAALSIAVQALVERHEVLRTIYPAAGDGEPTQEILSGVDVAIPTLDLRSVPIDARADEVRAIQKSFAEQPFKLDAELPLRVALWRLADDEHAMGIVVHHIAADGWSMRVLAEDFLALYQRASGDRARMSAALAVQFADYAVWQRNWFEAGEKERQLSYWRTQLGTEHPALPLPFDRPRGASQKQGEGRRVFVLPADLSNALRSLAREANASLFMVMLAMFKLLLRRFSGQADIRVGAPIANRHRTETHGLVAYLTNVQVLRTRVDVSGTFAELLSTVRAVVLDAQSHPDLPFDLLVESLQPERQVGVHPLFQVKCTQQEDVPSKWSLSGANVSIEGLSAGEAHFDLSLDFFDRQDGIEAVFAYAQALFDASTIARLERVFITLVKQVVARPGERLEDMDLGEPLGIANGETVRFPYSDVLDMWNASVLRVPGRAAVRSEQRSYTYAELDAHADRLAVRLMERGVGPDSRIGIYAERSCEFVLGVLATLKVGAAYVPLDPQLPMERLAYQLEDSKAMLLLAAQKPGWQTRLPVIALDFEVGSNAGTAELSTWHAQQAAYLIYTSGSTGQPKGVIVSRMALANYVQAVLQRLELHADATEVAMVSTVAADLGHTSLFGALCSGRTLHLIDSSRAFDPDRFSQYMTEHRIDVLKIVPSHFQALLQAAEPVGVVPRHALILGGEATPWSLLEQIRDLRADCRVFNHYGPTETTVGVLTQVAESANPSAATLPLGLPLANIQALVLDADLCPVPEGVAGELYLCGAGVARGYEKRPGHTAERFIASLMTPGERMYRTGDRVRRLADGSLEFLGRTDDQVKVRGYRVELKEVAQALLSHSAGVAQVEVVADADEEGRTRLLAYVVSTQEQAIDAGELRESLIRHLPDYMVPSAIMQLDALPLTANGKVDRRKLPGFERGDRGRYEVPRGGVEEALAEIWKKVLRAERVGRNDNFFEIGGDSILALQIIARARKQGVRITPKQLLELQTISAIAAVATTVAVQQVPAATAVQDAFSGQPFELTPVQRWFFEQDFSEPHHWNQSVMLTPTESVEPKHLQTAVEHVIAHHEALRMRFEVHDGQWRQSCTAPGTQHCFERVDLVSSSDVALVADQAQRSLTLGWPFKALWMDVAGRSGRLLLLAHHLVVDGVSWRVILEDIQTVYRQLCEGQQPSLSLPGTSLRSWSHALSGYARSELLRSELSYWQSVVGTQEESLPGLQEGSNLVADAMTLETCLDEEQTERLLLDVPQAYRTQINDILLVALARVLCAWGQRESVLVELEGHGREELDDSMDLSRTVGWFTTLFPVRLAPSSGGVDLSIKAIKETLRKVPKKGLGYGVLRYLSQEGKGLADRPYPQVTFNYLGQFDQSVDANSIWRLSRESSGAQRSSSGQRRTSLEIVASMHRGELRIQWTYSRTIHDEVTVKQLAASFDTELRSLIEHCVSGASGVTPSDFPLAGLDQSRLDQLPVSHARLADIYPLSPMQAGMLFHSLYNPAGTAYVNQLRIDIDGLDVVRFQAAWRDMFDRHEVLGTGFLQGDSPLQWIAKSVAVPLVEHDLIGEADSEKALNDLARLELNRGFDLAVPPLMRLVLVRMSDDRHHFIWTRHHLLLDGWSTARLMADLLAAYSGLPVASPWGRYRDYIAWLRTQDAAASENYWRALLVDVAEPTRLATSVRSPLDAGGHRVHRQVFDADETASLLAFAKRERITINTVMQAAWALLLKSHTGLNAVCFGATSSGRPVELPAVEQVLGLFINTLPVVVAVSPQSHIGGWLRDLQRQNAASREYEHTPLFDIQKWAGTGGQGLFDSILVFENYPIDEVMRRSSDRQLRFKVRESRDETTYPMTVCVHDGQNLIIEYAFDGQLFSIEQVEQFSKQVRQLLHSLIDSSKNYLGEVELLTEAEWQQLKV